MSLLCVDRSYPQIQEPDTPLAAWSDTLVIRLAGRLDRELDASEAIAKASQGVSAGKKIIWEFDLGLEEFVWKPDDHASFNGFCLAIEYYCKELFPLFKEQVEGAIVYRGESDVSMQFPRSWWDPVFQEVALQDYPLFALSVLSDYLHRLASLLPDAWVPIALFDLTGQEDAAQMSRLFAQGRFEHLCLGLKQPPFLHSGLRWQEGPQGKGHLGNSPGCHTEENATVIQGIVLPEDSFWNEEVLRTLNRAFDYFKAQGWGYRLIAEEKLTEEWDGLDHLLVINPLTLSHRTHRKLQGFIATGGEAMVMGDTYEPWSVLK